MRVDRVIVLMGAIQREGAVYHQEWFFNGCGTPCCLAGHATWLARGKPEPEKVVEEQLDGRGNPLMDPQVEGREWLEIDERMATEMFQPNPFEGNAMDRNHPPTTAEAVDMLAELIRTGRVDWYRERSVPAGG